MGSPSQTQLAEKLGVRQKMINDYKRGNCFKQVQDAYERAAQVLGSLAETYAAMGQKNKAVKILHK